MDERIQYCQKTRNQRNFWKKKKILDDFHENKQKICDEMHESIYFSLFIWLSVQSIRYSMYFGAGKGVGFLKVSPSAHKYSYRGPPDIVGHVVSLQYSETVP